MNRPEEPPQFAKGRFFRSLHERQQLFVIPNPWDRGSAKMLASLGFEALATTSAGLAFSLGRPDSEGALGLEETLENAAAICSASGLPVSGDLENGYGDDPQTCGHTILLAAKAGLVGGSIEDATGRTNDPIYAFDLAVERIRAASQAARSLPFPFVLTARAENFLHGRPDLTDTIDRLTAYAEAGAEVLYAPGLHSVEEISTLVRAVAPRPVNLLMGLANQHLSLHQVQDLGVRRVSLGSSFARAAYSALFHAAREVHTQGTFDFGQGVIPFAELNQLFKSNR